MLVAGSLAEELMFRGYPFQRLVEAIGAGGAIVVFSVLFGVVHLMNPGANPWGLLNTVVIGVVLSVAYLRTRALWLPWGIHFAWNATLGLGLRSASQRNSLVQRRRAYHGCRSEVAYRWYLRTRSQPSRRQRGAHRTHRCVARTYYAA